MMKPVFPQRGRNALRTGPMVLLTLLLAACGGGGSDGSTTTPPTSPPPTTPPPTAASVTFSTTSVSVTGDTGMLNAPLSDALTFTTANIPASGLWFRATQTGDTVRDFDLLTSGANSGRLQLYMWHPGQLGAGAHASTLRLEICTSEACTTQVGGSPFTITVNYTITGSATPLTTVSWGGGAILARTYSAAQTTPPEEQLALNAMYVPPTGLYLQRVGPSDGVIRSVRMTQLDFSTNGIQAVAFFALTLAPPASMGSGVFTGSISLRACFDAGCTRVVPGSNYTYSIDLILEAAESVHFTRRFLRPANGATDVAWSAARNALYVLSSVGLTNDAAVLQVDPATGQATQTLALGNQLLGRVAVADDGSRLFVSAIPGPAPGFSATRADAVVRRIALPGLAEESTVQLENSTQFASLVVTDLVAEPGQNTGFLASLEAFAADEGVYAYDSQRRPLGVPRVTTGSERGRYFSRGEAADIYYSLRRYPLPPNNARIERLQLDASGVQVLASLPLSTESREAHYGGGRLFLLDGRVLDAASGIQLGTLQIPATWSLYAMVVDPVRARVYAVTQGDHVLSFDMNDYELLALMHLGTSTQRVTFKHPIMKLWGSDGLAVLDGTNLVILSGPFFSTYDGSPTM